MTADTDEIKRLARELEAVSGTGRHAHIKDLATRILAYDPTNGFALFQLGSAQYHEARLSSEPEPALEEMHRTVSRAISLYPNEPPFYYQMYLYYLWHGGEQYVHARDSLLVCIKLDPQNAYYFRQLGEIYLINREADKAVKYLKEAVRLDPEVAEYRSRLALGLLRQHKIAECKQMAQRALSDDPDDMQVLDTVGMIYILLGELDKAEKFFRDAIRRDPTYNYFHQHMDWIKRELQDKAKRDRDGRRYTPLYIRQKGSKRFFDEDRDPVRSDLSV